MNPKNTTPDAVIALATPPTKQPAISLHELLDKQDLLQALKVSARTIQRWRDTGLLPYLKIGGKIYYAKSVLEKLLERNAEMGRYM